MKFKFAIFFAIFALAIASAESAYKVTVRSSVWVGGNELKPGDYKVEVAGNKVTLTRGKNVVETSGRVETNDTEFESTALVSDNSTGKLNLQQIRVGGTKTRIVLENSTGGGGGTR